MAVTLTCPCVKLPLAPPVQPQLAKSARDLPDGEGWRYEPKWDGFRTIVFRDADDVHLQSRNGRPMNRYFPDIVEQVLALPSERLVLDGEMVVTVDGIQEFDLLSQRIHPAASRVERLAKETPAQLVAFDLLAEDDETLLELPYDERRERLAAVVADPVELTESTPELEAAGKWLAGTGEGVIAKEGAAPYRPGERVGMLKIKRVRTADAVVVAFRFGKEEGTVGSLILGMYDDAGELHVVGHTSSFRAKQKREFLEKLEPYRTGERGHGEPSRWKSEEELIWEGLRPELVVEVGFDHITGNRIRHGAKLQRWREDKEPRECLISQLRE
jgi:ATP-dependent DNA ligase